MLELNNLEEASKPSVERKFDEYGGQSTGIPVISLCLYLINFQKINLMKLFY